MGVGVAVGDGVGTDVKGGWRINAFLFLLTGWQAVLLPWFPLILKTAGFSARGVGVVTGVGTVVSSVGVGACLGGVRRSRSGALRRLLLLVLLSAATALQVAAVALLQQRVGAGGLHSCRFPPSPLTQIPPPTPSLSITSPSLTASSPAYTPAFSGPSPTVDGQVVGATGLRQPGGATSLRQPSNTTLHKPSPTTTITTTTTTTKTTTTTTPYNPPTTLTHDLLNSQTTSEKDSQGSVKDHQNAGVDGQDTEDASHRGQEDTPGGKKVTTPWYNNLLSGRDQSVAETRPVEDNPEAPEHRTKPEGSTDDRKTTSPEAEGPGDPDDGGQASDEEDLHNSASEGDVGDDGFSRDEGDYHYYSYTDDKQGDESSLDSSSSRLRNFPSHSKYPKPESSGMPSKDVSSHFSSRANPLKTPPQIPGVPWSSGSWLPTVTGLRGQHLIGTNHKTQSSPGNPLVADKHGGRPADTLRAGDQGGSYTNTRRLPPPPLLLRNSDDAELTLPDADSKRQESSPYHRLHHQSPYSRRFPSRPTLPAGQTGSSSGGQHDLLGHGARPSGWRGHHRGRRSLHQPGVENEGYDPGTKVDSLSREVTTTKPHDNFSQKDFGEGLSDDVGVQTGVAVLLIAGGLVGAGVEAAVAQLWHCYTHGYDEGGVSQDILQRTITHTFHLSTYASHKSWSGVTSGAWVVGGGVVSLLACMVGVETGAYGGLAGVHLALGGCALVLMLVLPIPYGAIDPPRTRRPLSLYLDDEVLREGLRRLAFHAWVFTKGCLAAFSLTYSLFLLQEMTPQGRALASQTGAVAVSLGSEGASFLAHRRFMTRCGLQGTMGVAGLALALHFASMWGAGGSVAVVVLSHACLGLALAAMWIAVKYNALLLATVTDQEREAWMSWWAWRVGLGVGAAVWGLGVEGAGGRVRPLLPFAVVVAAITGAAVGLAAALTRHHWRSRRRVYHTLDLDVAEDGDEDDEEPFEDDWLVKRAKKEGITI